MSGPSSNLPVEVIYDGLYLPGTMCFKDTIDQLKAGKGPDYDFLCVTYPRAGTARLVEIMWLIENNIDTKTAKEVKIDHRHLFLEVCSPDFTKCFGHPFPPGIRLAKTHLPYQLVSKHVESGKKMVVGLRNPKDNLVSLYHFYRMAADLGNFKGTFSEFFEIFKAKKLMYGDVIDFSVGWWNQRNRDNVYVCFYEDLNESPFEEVEKIAKFMGKNLSKEQIEAIVQWTAFNNMKKEKSVNYDGFERFDQKVSPYMRKATVGDWANHMSAEESKYIDDICKKQCEPIGLKFKF